VQMEVGEHNILDTFYEEISTNILHEKKIQTTFVSLDYKLFSFDHLITF